MCTHSIELIISLVRIIITYFANSGVHNYVSSRCDRYHAPSDDLEETQHTSVVMYIRSNVRNSSEYKLAHTHSVLARD